MKENRALKKKEYVIFWLLTVVVIVLVCGYYVQKNTYKKICKIGDVSSELTVNVDEYSQNENLISVAGWAIKKGVPTGAFDMTVILWNEKENLGYEIPTAMAVRSDVTSAMEDGVNYDHSGFSSKIIIKDHTIAI